MCALVDQYNMQIFLLSLVKDIAGTTIHIPYHFYKGFRKSRIKIVKSFIKERSRDRQVWLLLRGVLVNITFGKDFWTQLGEDCLSRF